MTTIVINLNSPKDIEKTYDFFYNKFFEVLTKIHVIVKIVKDRKTELPKSVELKQKILDDIMNHIDAFFAKEDIIKILKEIDIYNSYKNVLN